MAVGRSAGWLDQQARKNAAAFGCHREETHVSCDGVCARHRGRKSTFHKETEPQAFDNLSPRSRREKVAACRLMKRSAVANVGSAERRKDAGREASSSSVFSPTHEKENGCCFRNDDGELLCFHRKYANMAEAQQQLHLNGFYMMLIVSVLLNLSEKWGLDHGKIGNIEDIAYPRKACTPGGSFLCADTILWYAYNPPSFMGILMSVVYFLKYDDSRAVFATILCSMVVVGWEFPFLSNHSNLYLFISLFTMVFFTPISPTSRSPAPDVAQEPGGSMGRSVGDDPSASQRWWSFSSMSSSSPSLSNLDSMKRLLGSALAIVYFVAGFHKLNSDFMRGCGVNFLARFVHRFVPDAWGFYFMHIIHREEVFQPLNASILVLELLSGLLMFIPSAAWIGITGAIALHAILSLISFYDFAAVALAVLYIIVPILDDDRCAHARSPRVSHQEVNTADSSPSSSRTSDAIQELRAPSCTDSGQHVTSSCRIRVYRATTNKGRRSVLSNCSAASGTSIRTSFATE